MESLFCWYTAENLHVSYFYMLCQFLQKSFFRKKLFVFTESCSSDQLLQKAYL